MTGSNTPKSNLVFTVGHSNQSTENFLAVLELHHIEILVDVRSHPFSKYAVQFNYDDITISIKDSGKKYLYLGRELGGMPKDRTLYDEEGNVLYWKIAASSDFQEGIERLLSGIKTYRIALMCAEENPTNCHRRHLIARALREHGIEIRHIRAKGLLQSEEELEKLDTDDSDVQQLSIIFAPANMQN